MRLEVWSLDRRQRTIRRYSPDGKERPRLDVSTFGEPAALTQHRDRIWVLFHHSSTIVRFRLDGCRDGDALRTTALHYPIAIASMDDTVWVTNEEGTIVRFNTDGTVRDTFGTASVLNIAGAMSTIDTGGTYLMAYHGQPWVVNTAPHMNEDDHA